MEHMVQACPKSMVGVFKKIQHTLDTDYVEAFLKLKPTEEAMLKNSSNFALILGSEVWDVLNALPSENSSRSAAISQARAFSDHLQAVRRLVQRARERFPNATILWKSPTVMHIL